ncbi:MAG: ubiquinone/menaquinone biosynthesis methyltransferase [Myxococcota bacterium]|nr:ubiquinone/menaquinone biosynthesis methyltransferase [Myxococcota bacterium]
MAVEALPPNTGARAAATDALPPSAGKALAVRTMFDRIAPRYDGLNRLLTGGLDRRWRRLAVDAVAPGPGSVVLDLACGTGDLCELAAARGAEVVGVDFAGEMLRGAQRRRVQARLVQGDAARLPLPDESADGALCGFALRNFVSLPEAFAELARVLRPGARVAFIEVDRPRQAWLRAAHSFYFDRVVPLVGGLLSDRSAYRYLPQSTVYLPDAPALRGLLESAGFGDVERRPFLFGAAQLVTATREARS